MEVNRGAGGWGNSGRDVGCGGVWRNVVDANGRKMGRKWENNGKKYPFFTAPFFGGGRCSPQFPL